MTLENIANGAVDNIIEVLNTIKLMKNEILKLSNRINELERENAELKAGASSDE